MKTQMIMNGFWISVLLAGCAPLPIAQIRTNPTTVSLPDPTPAFTESSTPAVVSGWELEATVENLEVPWSIVFTSLSRMLVSERKGRIRAVVDDQLQPEALYTFEDVASQDEAGLMGMALDPDYSQNKYLYACYSATSSNGIVNRVVRLVDLGDELLPDGVILDGIPSARFHAGCRLGFGPDEKLYISSGDALIPQAAQDTDSLAGKILRINPDGSIPSDNPIAGSPVYSYGHRNPQGLAWETGSGDLYSSEHGPSGFDGPPGGDELNLIRAGGNYGWPLVSHDETRAGTEAALLQFTPAIAPAAIMIYTGDALPMFRGDLFMGALRGEGLARVRLAQAEPLKTEDVEWIVRDVGRVREVTQGPDGLIYFSTSNRDGRGQPRAGDDKIYRIVPIFD